MTKPTDRLLELAAYWEQTAAYIRGRAQPTVLETTQAKSYEECAKELRELVLNLRKEIVW